MIIVTSHRGPKVDASHWNGGIEYQHIQVISPD